jgi:hypothetical protein
MCPFRQEIGAARARLDRLQENLRALGRPALPPQALVDHVRQGLEDLRQAYAELARQNLVLCAARDALAADASSSCAGWCRT